MTSKDAIREEYDRYRSETAARNETVFTALSGLKRLVLGAVFERHFDAAANGDDTETEWERLPAYKNEAVYLRAHQNCVRVIYQIQVCCYYYFHMCSEHSSLWETISNNFLLLVYGSHQSY